MNFVKSVGITKKYFFACFMLLSLLFLSACASKQSLPDPILPAEKSVEENTANVQFKVGVKLLQNEKLVEAKPIFENILKQFPDYQGPLLNLGIIALKQNDLSEAKSFFQQVVRLNESHAQAINFLGVIARKEGRFDEAETFYRKVLTLDSQNQMALRNLGVLLDLYRGRLSEALALYQQYQALQTTPNAQVKDWIFDIKSRIKSESK